MKYQRLPTTSLSENKHKGLVCDWAIYSISGQFRNVVELIYYK